MSTLDELPEELVDRTIRYAADDGVTLANLSLVSRRFHRITEPHLYGKITFQCCFERNRIVRTNLVDLVRGFEHRPFLTK